MTRSFSSLFDFFANCEYFEEKFDYDEKLKLPQPKKGNGEGGGGGVNIDKYTTYQYDPLLSLVEELIGPEGMRIDRELFKKV
jgi:type I restriction enzyme, R subunit